MKYKDEIGKIYGMLQVIKRVTNSKFGKVRYLCKCKCGNTTVVDACYLRNGRIKSCGCYKGNKSIIKVDVGSKFEKLTVKEFVGKDKHGNKLWKCQCTCGNETIVTANNLRKGHTKSCGCYKEECRHTNNFVHGKTSTRLYNIYKSMCQRCYNKDCFAYKDYGGRGIHLCKEWKNNFQNFYEWSVTNGYKKSLEIDRINVNGNYTPDNCRWVNNFVQANNRRNNRYITIHGETKTLAEWCRLYNISTTCFYHRIKKFKWSEVDAIKTPLLRNYKTP